MKTKIEVLALTVAALAALIVRSHATDLSITQSGTQVIVSWPQATTDDFYLESTPDLMSPITWRPTADPITNGNAWIVTNEARGTSRFFRLHSWEVLFDGSSTSAFRGYRQADFPGTNQWIVTLDGDLMSVSNAAPIELITRSEYSSYELRWEWKSSTNGNAGVQYRVNENYTTSASAGPEYQLFDDLRYPSAQDKLKFGAVYGLFAPTNKALAPVGQWNQCRLILQGNHVQHWLNGNKVVEYDINSAAWTNALTAWGGSLNVPGFGQGTGPGVGHILLRNDRAPTWYRNIKIRPISAQ